MNRHVTLWAWLLVLALVVFFVTGLATGFSLGRANAETCSGFSGPFGNVNINTCSGGCTGFSIFGLWTQQCPDYNNNYPPVTAEVLP